MSSPAGTRQPRERALRQPKERLQDSLEAYEEAQESLDRWQRELNDLERYQRQQQQQQRQHRLQQPSYLDSISAPVAAAPAVAASSSGEAPPLGLSFASIPSFSAAYDPLTTEDPPVGGDEDDATWLVAVVLTTALLVTIASLVRSCCQMARGLPSFLSAGNENQTGGRPQGSNAGHGPGGGPSRYPHLNSGPQQVPGEDEPDPDQGLNENDERWAQLTDAQRQAYDSARAFQAVHPPLSVPTDISLSQFLSIQEKGVSAWEFEASFDNQRVQVHDRTELSFPPMNQLEASVQTNLPMPKQQEVYYWEVKMFEKSPDTVVAVGVSTKPYPNARLPGWNRHSVAYHSRGQKYCNSTFSGLPYGPSFYEGDVVGCGYRPRSGTIFFTRNGKRIEDAYKGLTFNLFPTVGATGPCVLHVNFGQSGFVFVEANVKKWGLAPASGSLAPPPAYGSERGSILLEAGATAAPRGPAPPTRRPQLQSMQSRARIEAAGVLVQIDEDEGAGESGSDHGGGRRANVAPQQHISLANMSAPTSHGPPPRYSSIVEAADGTTSQTGTRAGTGRTRSHSESDEETTALIADTISRPIGGRGRSGTTTSVASASGGRR